LLEGAFPGLSLEESTEIRKDNEVQQWLVDILSFGQRNQKTEDAYTNLAAKAEAVNWEEEESPEKNALANAVLIAGERFQSDALKEVGEKIGAYREKQEEKIKATTLLSGEEPANFLV